MWDTWPHSPCPIKFASLSVSLHRVKYLPYRTFSSRRMAPSSMTPSPACRPQIRGLISFTFHSPGAPLSFSSFFVLIFVFLCFNLVRTQSPMFVLGVPILRYLQFPSRNFFRNIHSNTHAPGILVEPDSVCQQCHTSSALFSVNLQSRGTTNLSCINWRCAIAIAGWWEKEVHLLHIPPFSSPYLRTSIPYRILFYTSQTKFRDLTLFWRRNQSESNLRPMRRLGPQHDSLCTITAVLQECSECCG